MITNPHTVHQLVAAHERELVETARSARLRKAARVAAPPARPWPAWRRRAVECGSSTALPLSSQPTTQIAR